MLSWLIGAALVWGLVEASLIRVTTLRNVGLIPFRKRIVFVSDIHFDTPIGFNHWMMKRLIRLIRKQKPDLLIIGGDIINQPRHYKNPVFKYFGDLGLETVAVLGNHDCLDRDEVLKQYRDVGIRVLINEGMEWQGLYLYGVDDYRLGYPRIDKTMNKERSLLLTHEPEVMRNNPQAKGFGFGLAGHHHGGQITFFGYYAPAVKSEYGQDLVKGHVQGNGMKGYVSNGVGGFPLRFFARPEIIVLED